LLGLSSASIGFEPPCTLSC